MTPGSPEAVNRGCTCPVFDNGHGRGYMGTNEFWVTDGCPVHSPKEPEPDTVEIAGRLWTIVRVESMGMTLYYCGTLPGRRRREDLIADIERAQGPEWRR